MADLLQGGGRGGRDGSIFTFTILLAPSLLKFADSPSLQIDEMLKYLSDENCCRNVAFGSYLLSGSGINPCSCFEHGPLCTCQDKVGMHCDVCCRTRNRVETQAKSDNLVPGVTTVAALKTALPSKFGTIFCWICYFCGLETDKHALWNHFTCKCRQEGCKGCSDSRSDNRVLSILIPPPFCIFCGLKACSRVQNQNECFLKESKRTWETDALPIFLLQLNLGKLWKYEKWRKTLPPDVAEMLPKKLSERGLQKTLPERMAKERDALLGHSSVHHGSNDVLEFLRSNSLTKASNSNDEIANFHVLCIHYISWRSSVHQSKTNPAKRQKLKATGDLLGMARMSLTQLCQQIKNNEAAEQYKTEVEQLLAKIIRATKP